MFIGRSATQCVHVQLVAGEQIEETFGASLGLTTLVKALQHVLLYVIAAGPLICDLSTC